MMLGHGAWAGESEPWIPVPGHVPVQPGEHPRLYVRKADIPALRKRAETPEGRLIVARLKVLLGGGEAMPTSYNTFEHKNEGARGAGELPVGTWTLSHGSGFGMLYLLTGDKKYADLGRQCVEKAFTNQNDRDGRFCWKTPGGRLRAGPVVRLIAEAYDLCYDGWDEAFRTQVAKAIQDYDGVDKGSHIDMPKLAVSPKHSPGTNHWGPQVGGATIALLAIMDDPGVDATKVKGWIESAQKHLYAGIANGFGDGGYFFEHSGPSHNGAYTALVSALQVSKVALGRDYISPRPNAAWITMRFVHEAIAKGGAPFYPCRHPNSYGTEAITQGGLNRGVLAQGFGAIPTELRPALHWYYKNLLLPNEANNAMDKASLKPGEPLFDAITYPHHAWLALVNWPIGEEPRNPEGILPKARQDTLHGYYVFRNRWKDDQDIVVTALMGARAEGNEPVMVWGLGERKTFGAFPKCKATHVRLASDGSGTVSGGGIALGVDFSKASGADALIVMVGGGASGGTAVTAGGTTFQILALKAGGAAPQPMAAGDKVAVGGQSISFAGGNLVFATMAGPPPEKVGR